MKICDNFVRAEVEGKQLMLIYRCERCGGEYKVRNSGMLKSEYCGPCRNILAEERAKEIEYNHEKKAIKKIRNNIKAVVSEAAQFQSVVIDGEKYIRSKDVLDAINSFLE